MANYHRWLWRLQGFEHKRRTSSLYLLSLMGVSFLLGAFTYNTWLSFSALEEALDDSEVRALKQQVQIKTRELAATKLTLDIEQEANQNMRTMFNEQLAQQKELSKELAFYRSLMAPESTIEGVGIHALELASGLIPEQYQLRLILTQLQKRKQSSKATAEIMLLGVQQGEAKSYNLAELVNRDFEFAFTYFQIMDVEFSLPAEFNLQRIQVTVNVKSAGKGKGGQTQEVYNVPELLQGEKELRVILEQNSQVIDNSEQKTEVRGSND